MGKIIKSYELNNRYSFDFELIKKGYFIVEIRIEEDLIFKKVIID
jgi:hypothetical protein